MITLKTKEFRELNNISLKDLSKISGVSRGYLSDIEHGNYKNPGVLVVGKLCKALNTTPNDLINEEVWKGE